VKVVWFADCRWLSLCDRMSHRSETPAFHVSPGCERLPTLPLPLYRRSDAVDRLL